MKDVLDSCSTKGNAVRFQEASQQWLVLITKLLWYHCLINVYILFSLLILIFVLLNNISYIIMDTTLTYHTSWNCSVHPFDAKLFKTIRVPTSLI